MFPTAITMLPAMLGWGRSKKPYKAPQPIPSDFAERASEFAKALEEYEKCLADFKAMLDENQRMQMEVLQMASQRYLFASQRLTKGTNTPSLLNDKN